MLSHCIILLEDNLIFIFSKYSNLKKNIILKTYDIIALLIQDNKMYVSSREI